jgi:hypothetical protein
MGEFLRLPVEVIHLIADQTTTEELGYLRRTCKIMETILFDRFATEFFSIRQICLHPISVQSLVDISNHPEFSKAIRKVIICDEKLESINFPIPQEVESESMELRSSQLGQGWDSIADALGRLPNCRTIEERDFIGQTKRPREQVTWRSFGVRGLESRLPVRMYPGGPTDLTSADLARSSLLRAIARASAQQLRLESFECINRSRNWIIKNLYIGQNVTSSYEHAFAPITTLMLCLDLIENSCPASSIHLRSFSRFLDLFPNLEMLRINLLGRFTSQFPEVVPLTEGIMAYIGSKQGLCQLELGKAEISFEEFQVLVNGLKNSKQFRSLSLHRVGFYGGKVPGNDKPTDLEFWQAILELCKDLEHLDTLRFTQCNCMHMNASAGTQQPYLKDANDAVPSDRLVIKKTPNQAMAEAIEAVCNKLVSVSLHPPGFDPNAPPDRAHIEETDEDSDDNSDEEDEISAMDGEEMGNAF